MYLGCLLICTHVSDRFFFGTIAHTLFASLSHAALETWLTVLTRAGEGIYAVFNVLIRFRLLLG